MFDFKSAITSEADRSAKIGKPFIGPYLPFVGPELPVIKPSIGILRPFVGFSGFLGFTLIELLVTIVIAAILVGLALPNLRVFIQKNRLQTEASELYAALNFARMEAKANAAQVKVCVSSNQTSCTGTAWSQGWLAWVDTDDDGVVDASEKILRVRAAPNNGIVLLNTAGGALLGFSASGAMSSDIDFRFQVCDDTRTDEEGRSITINGLTGNARLKCLRGTDGRLCTIPEQQSDADHPQCT